MSTSRRVSQPSPSASIQCGNLERWYFVALRSEVTLSLATSLRASMVRLFFADDGAVRVASVSDVALGDGPAGVATAGTVVAVRARAAMARVEMVRRMISIRERGAIPW